MAEKVELLSWVATQKPSPTNAAKQNPFTKLKRSCSTRSTVPSGRRGVDARLAPRHMLWRIGNRRIPSLSTTMSTRSFSS